MMGLTPRQVGRLTLPELAAMFDGYRLAQGGKPDDDMPDEPSMDAFFAHRAVAMANGQA